MEPILERSLHRLFLANGGKAIHKWAHYLDIYERHFRRFVDRNPRVLEIGVAGGGSLALWRSYFGAGSRIVGLDIRPTCRRHRAPGVEIVIGSQDDPAVLDQVLAKYDFDVVIDDGSHRMEHVQASFEHLYPRIDPHGVYLVEDMHTSYWEEYGGGLRAEGTFMEYTKAKLDELNATHTRGALPPTPFTVSTASIHIYDSIMVFERAPQGKRLSIQTETMPPP